MLWSQGGGVGCHLTRDVWEVVEGGGVDVVLVVVRRVRLRVVRVVDQQSELTLSQTRHPPKRGQEHCG